MARNVGEVEIIVSADGSTVAPEVKGVLAAADRMANKFGDRLSKSMSKSLAKGFGKIVPDFSKISGKLGSSMESFRNKASGIFSRFGDDGERHTGRVSRAFSAMGAGLRSGLSSLGGAISSFGSTMSGAAEKITKKLNGIQIPGGKLLVLAGALVSVIPLITSALGALTGGLIALVGSLGQAAASSASLIGVFGGLGTAGIVLGIGLKGLGDAIGGDAEAMAKLSDPAKKVATTLAALQKPARDFQRAISASLLRGVGVQIQQLADTYLPLLSKKFSQTGSEINTVFDRLVGFVTSEKYVRDFGVALDGNNKIFRILGRAAVPILKGITDLYIALQPAAQATARAIVRGANAFARFTATGRETGSIAKFMEKAQNSARLLGRFLGNLSVALLNVFKIAAGPGNGLIRTFGDLAIKFRAFTESASGKNKIRTFINDSVQALRIFGSIIGPIANLIKGLFDPQIFGSFVSTIKSLAPQFSKIFDILQSALGPVFEQISKSVAELAPKIAKLFVALAPLLKGIGAVIGQVIKQATAVISVLLDVLTPVIGFLSAKLGPVIEKLAPIIATLILGFTGLGSAFVRLIPIVGRFIAPFLKIAEFFLGKLGAAFKFVGNLIGGVFGPAIALAGGIIRAFLPIVISVFGGIQSFITNALNVIKAVFSVVFNVYKTIVTTVFGFIKAYITTVFGIYRKIISTVLNVIKNVISKLWNAYKTVIVSTLKVIQAVVSGAFTKIRTIISTVMAAVKAVINKIWNDIKNTIAGVVKKVIDVISSLTRARDRAKEIFKALWDSVKNLAKDGITKLMGLITGLVDKIKGTAGRLLNAGKTAGKAIIDGIFAGIKGVGGLISDLAQGVKNAINGALNLPFTIKGPGPLPDFTIPAFANGTNYAPGGLSLVGERGPELVNLPRGSKVSTAAETRRMANSADGGSVQPNPFPRRVTLTIGSEDFEAFVEDIADDRITASMSLRGQGSY